MTFFFVITYDAYLNPCPLNIIEEIKFYHLSAEVFTISGITYLLIYQVSHAFVLDLSNI